MEKQILENIWFLEPKNSHRTRLWCDIIIIEPIDEEKAGRVSGYSGQTRTFTFFYSEGEKVGFKRNENSPHGTLLVGKESYHIESPFTNGVSIRIQGESQK